MKDSDSDSDVDGGGGDHAGHNDGELAQPSFNDRLNIIDFPAVSMGDTAGEATAPDASPTATSLHTPTPPDVDHADEEHCGFQLSTSPSTHYGLHRYLTITTDSKQNACATVSVLFARTTSCAKLGTDEGLR